ncbi:uncharacterized protein [Procambarus clarkii]|uniref:uncharacterized protein isoform X1 n=1 Tax=Procambarus clarkii TaxID=6728 RepID=UPI0037435F5B
MSARWLLYLSLLWALDASSVTQQPKKRKSCVKEISITENNSTFTSGFWYRLHLLEEPRCSLENKTWKARLLSCKDNKEVGTFKLKEVSGFLCAVAGCQVLEVRHTLSKQVLGHDDHISVEVFFDLFDVTGLKLALRSDSRVRSWDVTILQCRSEDEFNLQQCKETIKTDIGNSTFLELQEQFLANKCYYFHLRPNGYNCTLLAGVNLIQAPNGCHPSIINPTELAHPIRENALEGMVVVMPLVTVVVVVAAVVMAGVTSVVYKRRCWHSASVGIGVVVRGGAENKPQVLVLRARDSTPSTHDGSDFVTQLRARLQCQVYDVLEGNGMEMIADPSQWLLQTMSTSSKVKVVLILSPAVLDLFHTLLEDEAALEVSSVDTDFRTRLVVAGLKRLLECDLVYNYSRVFVISFMEVEKNSGADLLASCRRYCLPQHWPELVLALTGDQDI